MGTLSGRRCPRRPLRIGNRKVDKGLNFYSIEREIALGKQLAREVDNPVGIRRESNEIPCRRLHFVGVPVAVWPQQAESDGRLYLLTASPNIHGPVTYPADLYTIENNKLQLVRHVVPAEDGTDFVLSSSLVLVRRSHISPKAFEIIHFDDPGSVDSVVPNLNQRFLIDAFIVKPPEQTMIALELSSSPGTGAARESCRY